MTHKIYSIDSYLGANEKFIKDKKNEQCYTLEKICEILKMDNSYHFRVHNNTSYIFFGDLDNYNQDISVFKNLLNDFMNDYYDLKFSDEDFKYTQNDIKPGSYHYSITCWNATTEKLKEIHTNFWNSKKNYFQTENQKTKCVDTTIYSEHWFRCPYQSKGVSTPSPGIHKIVYGEMKDFIITFIPDTSINITNQVFKQLDNMILKTTKLKLSNKNHPLTLTTKNAKSDSAEELILSVELLQTTLYKKLMDECYSQERFDDYGYWTDICKAIKNTIKDDDAAFDLFNYASQKSEKYQGEMETYKKYKSFKRYPNGKGNTIGTLLGFAKEDNLKKYIEIISSTKMELGQTDMCGYLQIINDNRFIYKSNKGKYTLYCYNGKFWEQDDMLLRRCISTELYQMLKSVLITVFWNSREFSSMKSKIDKLKQLKVKKDIIETYREYGVENSIKFDDRWELLGFTNKLYDMKTHIFRDYNYDDYVSNTTGYDWREPTEEELNTVQHLINTIMPDVDERELYLQILSTTLEGRCLEKFILFHGNGRNGKGLIDDLLLLALGHYGMIGNNNLVFETSRMGANPEKANIHKKRLVLLREPPAKHKFQNSIIKELTGGGNFSARTLHDTETNKELNLTMIVECNKRPLFAEEPDEAEVQRLIDINFKSTFTTEKDQIDPEQHVYEANPYYKTKEFQEKHKFALLKLLMDAHYRYYHMNNSIFAIPDSIKVRTRKYLDMSCNVKQFFVENYVNGTKNDYIRVKDLFNEFKTNDYYLNLTKLDKQKYNYHYFLEYIKKDIFFRKYYKARISEPKDVRTVIINWKKKQEEE